MRYINVNGKLIEAEHALVPHDNRAFRYGYGLFETMLVKEGTIQLASYHWERLFVGAKTLCLDIPVLMTSQKLEEEVLRTVSKNHLDTLCRVRLQLYGGNGGMLGKQSPVPGYIIECYEIEPHITELNEIGLVVGIAEGLVKSIDTTSNYKTTNALVYALAAQQAKKNKWNDALVLNHSGRILESTIANIFWIKDGELYTPPLTEGCITGIMRKYIMSKADVVERMLNIDTLLAADEVFLTNAVRHIKWIHSINNATYTNSLTTKLYSQLFP